MTRRWRRSAMAGRHAFAPRPWTVRDGQGLAGRLVLSALLLVPALWLPSSRLAFNVGVLWLGLAGMKSRHLLRWQRHLRLQRVRAMRTTLELAAVLQPGCRLERRGGHVRGPRPPRARADYAAAPSPRAAPVTRSPASAR